MCVHLSYFTLNCGHDTHSVCPITVKLHMEVGHDETRNSINFGQRVKVNFGILSIKPCGHNTDYTLCPITSKLHIKVVYEERRNPIDFGTQGRR